MNVDVAVIGAGIAGAAAAYELAATHRVVLLEREDQPGYHTTGRSAALYTETYGAPIIRALTRASRPFLAAPPPGFAERALLSRRGAMFVATTGQDHLCEGLLADAIHPGTGAGLNEIGTTEALAHVPALDPQHVRRAFYNASAMDIDVHTLHQGFLRAFKARGGQLFASSPVSAISRRDRLWHVRVPAGEIRAGQVVNAAGAWADEVAAMADVRPVGIVPKRRTALVFDPAPAVDATSWPMVITVSEDCYFKPESGRLLASPADETPSPPCDAQPEEIDVALACDRVERWTTLRVARVQRKWAGLRCFVSDKAPVMGEDGSAPGFFWLAGQGGYGIMTAPALSRAVGAAVRGEEMPADLHALGADRAALAPRRLREALRG